MTTVNNKLSRLKSTVSSDLLKQGNEVKSTESGRRFQRLINLSLKKRSVCGSTKTFAQFERVTSGARCSHYEEIIAVNTYQAKYNFITINQIKL